MHLHCDGGPTASSLAPAPSNLWLYFCTAHLYYVKLTSQNSSLAIFSWHHRLTVSNTCNVYRIICHHQNIVPLIVIAQS